MDFDWTLPFDNVFFFFLQMLTDVIFGNLVFLGVVFHATRKFLNASAGFCGYVFSDIWFVFRVKLFYHAKNTLKIQTSCTVKIGLRKTLT